MLERAGVVATQSSVSRDLEELGVVKQHGHYTLPRTNGNTARGVAIGARQRVMPVLFDDAELFEIARDTRLCRRHTCVFEQGAQVFLRANRRGSDESQNLLLPVSFVHSLMQSTCINAA